MSRDSSTTRSRCASYRRTWTGRRCCRRCGACLSRGASPRPPRRARVSAVAGGGAAAGGRRQRRVGGDHPLEEGGGGLVRWRVACAGGGGDDGGGGALESRVPEQLVCRLASDGRLDQRHAARVVAAELPLHRRRVPHQRRQRLAAQRVDGRGEGSAHAVGVSGAPLEIRGGEVGVDGGRRQRAGGCAERARGVEAAVRLFKLRVVQQHRRAVTEENPRRAREHAARVLDGPLPLEEERVLLPQRANRGARQQAALVGEGGEHLRHRLEGVADVAGWLRGAPGEEAPPRGKLSGREGRHVVVAASDGLLECAAGCVEGDVKVVPRLEQRVHAQLSRALVLAPHLLSGDRVRALPREEARQRGL
mmetsp:Transcript_7662/g.22414  ORF Transcript_7662/g.22414 Transcript_7662/m.22414 type:complete len:363 (-) Transcript_7662:531-1619(-)